ncbi:MmyB family transcriptional regulator [Nocardia sp. NBC_00403]|uniref:MmyB family transcriptional regulator n=1 Tax=Nocardia sp. NBC_00403 TaxID=2975990 RepID=UPI003FA600F3
MLDLIAEGPAFIVDHRLAVTAANPLAEMLYSRPMKGLNFARHIFLDEDGRTRDKTSGQRATMES